MEHYGAQHQGDSQQAGNVLGNSTRKTHPQGVPICKAHSWPVAPQQSGHSSPAGTRCPAHPTHPESPDTDPAQVQSLQPESDTVSSCQHIPLLWSNREWGLPVITLLVGGPHMGPHNVPLPLSCTVQSPGLGQLHGALLLVRSCPLGQGWCGLSL